MLDLYVDIDAHRVYPQVLQAAQRHLLDLYVVTNDYLHGGDRLHLILAQEGQRNGGRWILTNIARGDICVTTDFGLAACCMLIGATVLSPGGRQWNGDGGLGEVRRAMEAQPSDTHVFAQSLETTISSTRSVAFLRGTTQRSSSRVDPVATIQRFPMPQAVS